MQDDAVATARRYTGAPSTAVVRSVRLALYSDPSEQNVLVWVIALDGISRSAHRAFSTTSVPERTITREVWMVSATQAGQAIASFASLPPLK